MKCYYEYMDEHFGTGLPNIGNKQWFAELTEEDEPEIKDYIRKWIEESYDLPDETFYVYLYCEQADEEFEFEVNPYEYMDKADMEAYIENILKQQNGGQK